VANHNSYSKTFLSSLSALSLSLAACAGDDGDGDASNATTSAIIGGSEAPANGYPWTIALRWDGEVNCAGALVAPGWVLTAAHCFDQVDYSTISVIAGEHDQRRTSNVEQRRTIAFVLPHPDYQDSTSGNDIALVQLSSPFKRTSAVQTIDTYGVGTLPRAVQAVGWGETDDGTRARKLQEVTLPILPNSACNESFIQPGEFCAGSWGLGDHKDACVADSGGPVTERLPSGAAVLVGLVSRGFSPCTGRGVYTRVEDHHPWIRDIIDSSI